MPFLADGYHLGFYGGEPLLAFPFIERITAFLNAENKHRKKSVTYSITTNGYLLTDHIIRFFADAGFNLVLSYDGCLQDKQRRADSRSKLLSNINSLLQTKKIDFEINSVFTPETIGFLSDSIRDIIDLGVNNIRYSLSFNKKWDQNAVTQYAGQLKELYAWLKNRYGDRSAFPVVNLRASDQTGIFQCAAGRDRLALSPDGELWGCYLFYDYFKSGNRAEFSAEYSFGFFQDFVAQYPEIYPRILHNYSRLSMDNMATAKLECFLCKDIGCCCVCPVSAGSIGESTRKIPQYICDLQKIRFNTG